MVKVMQIFLVLGSIGTFIFLAACCGGNVWMQQSSISVITTGLWKSCYRSTCATIKPVILNGHRIELPGWFIACRAFAVLSVLAAVAGILLSVLSIAVEKIKGFFASLLLICASGGMGLALIIYASKINLINYEYGWSYFLGWLGAVGGVVAAVIGFVSEKC